MFQHRSSAQAVKVLGEREARGFDLSVWTKLETTRRVVSGELSC